MGHAAHGSGSPRLSAVFGVPEFRALWFAEVLSVAGDQLARLALTVVVLGLLLAGGAFLLARVRGATGVSVPATSGLPA